MRMTASVLAGVVAGMLSVVAAVPAQQPKVTNANLSVHSGTLQGEIAGVHAATWIGYSVPVVRSMTHWNDDIAHLEGVARNENAQLERKPGDPAPRANVLLRVTEGKVERVQIEEPSREVDAGGLPFVWLTDVRAADSVVALSAAIDAASAPSSPPQSGDREQIRQYAREQAHLEMAMVALALEDAPEVTPALRKFTAAAYPQKVRERAAFWLANERGREGFDAVTSLLKSETGDTFREQLLFDLTLVKGIRRRLRSMSFLRRRSRTPRPGSAARRSSGWRRWCRARVSAVQRTMSASRAR